MATPIQYVQQFIPSNVGLMSEQLGQMQQRYDKAVSDISNVEDLYGQLQVHPSDIAGKNAILGGFQSEIQKTVDRYGGDYGAASKDIARQITKLKQDPFFNIAAVKKARAEDEYKLRKQLGADYIPVKSVADIQAYNPETKEYASPEDIDFDYVNAKDLWEEAKLGFGNLAGKVRESKLAQSKEHPELLESTTYRGLYNSELGKTAQDIKTRLKEKFPNAPDDYINNLATDYASQLSGGWTKDYRDNTAYSARLRASQELSSSKYPFDSTPGYESNEASNKLFENANYLSDIGNKLSEVSGVEKSILSNPTTNPLGVQSQNQSLSAISFAKNKLIADRSSILSDFKKLGTFNSLIKMYGIPEEEAAMIAAEDKAGESGILNMRHFTSDPEMITGIVKRNFTRGTLENSELYPVYKEDPKSGKKEKVTNFWSTDPTIGNILSKNEVDQVGLDLEKGDVIFNTKTKDGDIENYTMSLNNIENSAVKQSWKKYNAVNKTYSGDKGFGTFITDKDGNVTIFNKNSKPAPGQYVIQVDYGIDPNTGKKSIFRELGQIDNNGRLIEVSPEVLAKSQVESIYDYFGLQPKYKKNLVEE